MMTEKEVDKLKKEFSILSFDEQIKMIEGIKGKLKSSFLFWGDGWKISDDSFDYNSIEWKQREQLNKLRYDYAKVHHPQYIDKFEMLEKQFYKKHQSKKYDIQRTNFIEHEKNRCKEFFNLHEVARKRYEQLTGKNGMSIDYGKKLLYREDLNIIISIENALDYHEFLNKLESGELTKKLIHLNNPFLEKIITRCVNDNIKLRDGKIPIHSIVFYYSFIGESINLDNCNEIALLFSWDNGHNIYQTFNQFNNTESRIVKNRNWINYYLILKIMLEESPKAKPKHLLSFDMEFTKVKQLNKK